MPGLTVTCRCSRTLKLPGDNRGGVFSCPQCHSRIRYVATPAAATSVSAPPITLTVRQGPDGRGDQIVIGACSKIEIGKAETADLRLIASSVSRKHCRLIADAGGWRIEDTGSTNGVFVNDQRVANHVLQDGDVVRIGDYELGYAPVGKARGGAAAHRTAAPVTPARPPARKLTLLESAVLADTVAAGTSAPADELFDFADETVATDGRPRPQPAHAIVRDGTCPNCHQPVSPEARICVACGTDLATGQRLHTDAGIAAMNMAEATDSRGSIVAYLKDCLWSFALICRLGNLLKFIVIAVAAAVGCMLAIAPIWGIFLGAARLVGFVVLTGWVCSYLFNVVVSAASGEDDLPDLGGGDGWWDDGVEPFFKFLGMVLLVHVPVLAYVFTLRVPWSALVDGSDPVVEALLWLRALLWPFAMLLTAVGGLACFMRPDLIIKTIAATFLPYLVVCGVTAGALAVVGLAADAAMSNTAILGGSPWAAGCILAVLNVACWIVVMRCIGLYYHHFKERFAWTWG